MKEEVIESRKAVGTPFGGFATRQKLEGVGLNAKGQFKVLTLQRQRHAKFADPKRKKAG